MTATLGLLAVIVFLAFVVEASLGFGSALVAVSFGSIVVGVDRLLPAFLPVNVVLSAYIVARYRRSITWPLLVRRVLPAMLVGLPLGLLAFSALPAPAFRRALGGFVLLLSALELWRMRDAAPDAARRLGGAAASALLVLGGVAHGAFATGGPILVYVTGRELGGDKASFRATLSTVWLTLNIAMVAGYLAMGKLGAESATVSLVLVVPLVLGLLLGEAIHARLPLAAFKKVVFVLVGVAGLVLLVDVQSLVG